MFALIYTSRTLLTRFTSRLPPQVPLLLFHLTLNLKRPSIYLSASSLLLRLMICEETSGAVYVRPHADLESLAEMIFFFSFKIKSWLFWGQKQACLRYVYVHVGWRWDLFSCFLDHWIQSSMVSWSGLSSRGLRLAHIHLQGCSWRVEFQPLEDVAFASNTWFLWLKSEEKRGTGVHMLGLSSKPTWASRIWSQYMDLSAFSVFYMLCHVCDDSKVT